METIKIIQPPKYSINNSAKPAIQIQNFFRVDHNSKFHQKQNNINNKNNSTHQYEIYYSSRSKSKERESETSYINKPKLIINNLPPEFNITNNYNNITNINEENNIESNNNIYKNNFISNSKDKVINNFLLGTKTESKLKNMSNNRTNSLTNIHVANNNILSFTPNELVHKNKNSITNNNNINIIDKKNNNINHFRTEGSELETTQENTNTKNTGFVNNYTSTGFKPFNMYNIKNAGKTVLKYDKFDFNNTILSEIEEIVPVKKEKNQKKKIYKSKDNKEHLINISGVNKVNKNNVNNKNNNLNKKGNAIKPIKINNYNNNYNYQRKVIPPIMNKNEKINFDNESFLSIKNTQISNLNNFNYSKFQKNTSNSNLNLLEQTGKTFTNFKNDLNFNFEGERKSLPVKNINYNNNLINKQKNTKVMPRPSSEDNYNNRDLDINNKNINIDDKNIIKQKIEELISLKKIPKNLNEGIFYKYNNGYKYFFDLYNIDCYLLKEIPDNYTDEIIGLIEDWNQKYRKVRNYIKIIGYKKYEYQPYYTIIIEYPTGGENFNDIINLIGFYDVKLLLNISQVIYENLSLLKNDKKYKNIIFCLCDIYLNINNHIKIIPPLIRNIQVSSNFQNEICQCKKLINKIINIFNYNKNNISLICFGISLLQLITQNLLFKMNSINYLINKDNFLNILKYKKCCLIHTILNIEINLYDNKNVLLLSELLKLYPECVADFIHICTKFNNSDSYNIIYKHDFLNMYDASNNIEIYTKELLKIITFDSNYNHNIISYKSFLEKFESLYKKLNINSYIFNKVFRNKKIINNFLRVFNISKNSDTDKLIEIIEQ